MSVACNEHQCRREEQEEMIIALSLFIRKITFLNSILESHRIKTKNDMVIWQIPNFETVYEINKSSIMACIVSEPFTLSSGYNFRLKLFTYGARSVRGEYMSLYVQLGLSDSVGYPFRGVFTFVVIDQTGGGGGGGEGEGGEGEKEKEKDGEDAIQHHSLSIKASGSNNSFQRPLEGEFNEENGIAKLISHDKLFSTQRYIHNNVLILGVSMRYDDRVL